MIYRHDKNCKVFNSILPYLRPYELGFLPPPHYSNKPLLKSVFEQLGYKLVKCSMSLTVNDNAVFSGEPLKDWEKKLKDMMRDMEYVDCFQCIEFQLNEV